MYHFETGESPCCSSRHFPRMQKSSVAVKKSLIPMSRCKDPIEPFQFSFNGGKHLVQIRQPPPFLFRSLPELDQKRSDLPPRHPHQ